MTSVAEKQLEVSKNSYGEAVVGDKAVDQSLATNSGFFLRKENEQLFLSWDGADFRPLKDAITGHFSANASGSPTATDIGLMLSADMKP